MPSCSGQQCLQTSMSAFMQEKTAIAVSLMDYLYAEQTSSCISLPFEGVVFIYSLPGDTEEISSHAGDKLGYLECC